MVIIKMYINSQKLDSQDRVSAVTVMKGVINGLQISIIED